MKINLLVVISLMVIMSATMVAPVMAATTGTSTITGNPDATIAITVTGSISNWHLVAGGANTDPTSVDLVVSSNKIGWTVSVRDASDNLKPQQYAGRMVQWDGLAYVATPIVLGANMTVMGATVAGSSGSSATLSSADQTIEIGLDEVSSQSMDITIGQAVAYTDPILPGSNVYRIIVTFTGSVA